MRVVAIDTCGPVAGVALVVGDEVRVRIERVTRGAEKRLVPWARDLCSEAGIRLADLDGVAVARGPGAFTGLRVGLATAVGLALGAGCPLWGGDSLASRALTGGGTGLVALDARKQRLYAARYQDGVAVDGPADVPPEVALAWMEAPFPAMGEGVLVYRKQVEEAGGQIVDNADDPGVAALARRGAQALARGEGADPVEVRPVYLRAPDAKKPKR